MAQVERIDKQGRSAEQLLRDVLAESPDQVMLVYVKDGQIFVGGSGVQDRIWRMGALAAALVEEWTFDSLA